MNNKKALIMVDLQKDFCPGGNLAVAGGDEVIPIANRLQAYFDVIIATKDWHPQDHMSFASNHPGKKIGELTNWQGMEQVLWPDHCVQGSSGADFHDALVVENIHRIFHKGTDRRIDSYSAFYDNAHLRSTGLGDYLRQQQVREVFLLGLATDYCVYFSALDAIREGFEVTVIIDACRGVELQAGDCDRAIDNMRAAKVKIVHSSELTQPL